MNIPRIKQGKKQSDRAKVAKTIETEPAQGSTRVSYLLTDTQILALFRKWLGKHKTRKYKGKV